MWAVSYSYSYSDVTYGATNNAAANGLSWAMPNVLPDATSPYVTVEVNGLVYRYTINKDPDADAKVHVRNEDAIDGGYIFEETDDWSGVPGATIQKYFSLPYTDSSRWGDGEIAVEGQGNIADPTVVYNYKLTVDDEGIKCVTPLADSTCPGFLDALRSYLSGLDSLNPDDPFYDEWVQAQLENEAELEEEETASSEEENEDESLERQLNAKSTIEDLNTGRQADMLAQLTQTQKIEEYYLTQIPGGEYTDALVLEDTTLPDNSRALRNLASDANHKSMVRSQYEN